MKRIFTKVFAGEVLAAAPAPGESLQLNAYQSWLAQEPIEVIGAQARVHSDTPSENDGFARCEIELSQVGVLHHDGAILSVTANEDWNTAPPGIAGTAGNVAVTFPDGYAIPVKEEGYLFINAQFCPKSAGQSNFRYEVIVYYTKKSSR